MKKIFILMLFFSPWLSASQEILEKIKSEYPAGCLGILITGGAFNLAALMHELGHASVGALSGCEFEKIVLGETCANPFFKVGRFEYNPGNIGKAQYYFNGPNNINLIPLTLAGPLAGMLVSYGALQATGESSPLRYIFHAIMLETLKLKTAPRIFLASAVLKKYDDCLLYYKENEDLRKAFKSMFKEPLFARDDNGIFSLMATYSLYEQARNFTHYSDGKDILEELKVSESMIKNIKSSNKVIGALLCGLGLKKMFEE